MGRAVTRGFLLRLALDFVAAGLFLAALAYYWLDNAAHEWIGTVMFALVLLHNIFNRRWYGTIAKGRHAPRRILSIAINLSLLATMLTLLTTSLIISRTTFGFLNLDGGFIARQLHILSAYWVLVVVSIHLGKHWPMIMDIVRSRLGIAATSKVRRAALAGLSAAIALQGLSSSFEMTIGSKLVLHPTLDVWDFNESTLGFFLHYASIIGLYVVLTHYAMRWMRGKKSKFGPTCPIPANSGEVRNRRLSRLT